MIFEHYHSFRNFFSNFPCFFQFYQVHSNFYQVCQKLAEIQANSKGLTVDKLDKNWNEPEKTRKTKEKLRKFAKNYGNAQKSLQQLGM